MRRQRPRTGSDVGTVHFAALRASSVRLDLLEGLAGSDSACRPVNRQTPTTRGRVGATAAARPAVSAARTVSRPAHVRFKAATVGPANWQLVGRTDRPLFR